jgi:cytochrome c-type biogenesis protein
VTVSRSRPRSTPVMNCSATVDLGGRGAAPAGQSLMNALVYSSSLAAAFLGGVLALFAPCCVVSLLPTFVGAALERGRLRLPAMAAFFAAGIASVMLPIVLGVGLLGQLLAAQHRVVFFVVGLFLVLLALQVLSGRPWLLPFPMLRLRVSGSTPGGIFALGLTAGVASSCCAPVLAGVVALSALASSVAGALGLGLAYVFGMVFPLLVTVLVWDRVHPGSRGFALRTRRIRIRGWSLLWTDAVAAVMFLTIGILALLIAYTGQSTYLPGWLEGWNHWATGLVGNVSVWLGSLPIAVQVIALGLLALAVVTALYRSWKVGPAPGRPRTGDAEPARSEAKF